MRTLPFLLLLVSTAAPAQLKISIPGTATPGTNDVTVDTNKATRTISCSKNSVFLRGNDGEFTLEGDCASIHVMGNHNTVKIEKAARIVTEGNDNTVMYRNPNTGVSTLGNGNKVSTIKE